MRKEIHDRLREGIVAAGIPSGAELARRAGIPASTMNAYLNGTRTPPLDQCRLIAPLLQMTAEKLFYGRELSRAGGDTTMATPLEVIHAAIEEAFLLAGYPPQTAQLIASRLQLIVSAHPSAPPGMTQQETVRELVRNRLFGILPPKGSQSP